MNHLFFISEAVNTAQPDSIASIWPTALMLLLLLAFYGWLAARVSSRSLLTTQPFGIPDALCVGILATWMISVIWQSLDAPKVITLSAIVANSVVYTSLILGIFGVIGFRGLSGVSLFGLEPSRFPKAAGTGLIWLIITYP
ncbi:MAG: hypothetical protein WCI42_01610, partial [Verrucomicrobiota bacterium]